MDRSLTTTISINPWRTVAECTKLASYALILVLAFLLARADEWAARLLNALLAITAAYSAYALALGISGYVQYQFFYSTPPVTTGLMSGPFVSHNSYATFTGMGSIVAAIKLTRDIGLVQVRGLDRRRSTLNLLQFFFGKGAWTVLALVLTTSTLFASASRAGVFATITSLFAIVVVQTVFQAQNAHSKWSARALSGVILLIGLLAVVNGSVLSDRLSQLVSSGGIDEVRGALWEAGLRMIHSAPLTGFGLGTFQDAYPQFADVVMPYVVDKAHNDYLELAAGLGLPAAGIWLLAWLWLAVRCVRGIFVRKRNRHYSLIAFGTSVLVAVHSVVDFSLQIPAIAVTYATLLGIGLAQSSSTRSGRSA